MADKDTVQDPSTPSTVGVGSREAGQIAQIESVLKDASEGPVLSTEVAQVGVETVPDPTAPPPFQATATTVQSVQVEEPLKKEEPAVPGSPLTLSEVRSTLAKEKDPTSPLADLAQKILRQFDRIVFLRKEKSAPS